ncbi:hypothetical protein PV392_11215 [Streptomyces sp. ME03-5709C]|nr:hypothetical protein [Streptomyces sp. ME03-5709C]
MSPVTGATPGAALDRGTRIVNVSSTSASLSVTSEPGTVYAADHICPTRPRRPR